MRFHILRALMSPEPGAGGGAGGAGGGTPGAFDEDAFMQKVAQMVQKALTSRDGQADKRRTEDQKQFKAMLDDALNARGAGGGDGGGGTPPDDGQGGKGKNKNQGGVAGDDGVKFTTLQKRLDEQERATQAMQEKYQQERQARRQVGLLQRATDALNSVGITGERAEAARDALLYRGRVGFADDDSDEVVFRGDDNLPTELALGMRQWAKSQGAQIYLPPSGIGGSGSRPGARGGPGTDPKNMTNDQRMTVLADLFDRNIG